MNEQNVNEQKTDFLPRKKRILYVIGGFASLIGFVFLFLCDWKIGVGGFLIVFALHVRLKAQEEINQNAFVKIFQDMLK